MRARSRPRATTARSRAKPPRTLDDATLAAIMQDERRAPRVAWSISRPVTLLPAAPNGSAGVAPGAPANAESAGAGRQSAASAQSAVRTASAPLRGESPSGRSRPRRTRMPGARARQAQARRRVPPPDESGRSGAVHDPSRDGRGLLLEPGTISRSSKARCSLEELGARGASRRRQPQVARTSGRRMPRSGAR